MLRRINLSGLVIAWLGFLLTRFTVTLAIDQPPVRFYLGGIVPMVLGLGLAAFGVALTVADVDRRVVRTTATWSLLGTGAMLFLAVLTVLGSTAGEMPALAAVREQTYLSNFLIGGAVGGAFTGLYAARNRRQRTVLEQQTRRLQVLNRVLRHEVLNALNVIQGYADRTGTPESSAIIESHTGAIADTIEEVKYLTRPSEDPAARSSSVDLAAALERSIATVREAYPDAELNVEEYPDGFSVRATDRLDRMFTHLLENGIEHADSDRPVITISTESGPRTARVHVRDNGPGLPDRQRRLLETGEILEFDDPGTGFGLNVVRLLVENFDGDIETEVDEGGSTITVVLQRATPTVTGFAGKGPDIVGARPRLPHLLVTFGAALIAAVSYGVVAEVLGSSVAGIGVFYGGATPVVGWLTHEFHSVVFGFMFAALVSLAPPGWRHRVGPYVGIGLAWGFALWVGAAGVIAPIWLQLLGYPAPIPSFSPVLLASHLAWGTTMGVLVALGYSHLVPRLEQNDLLSWVTFR